MIPKNKLQTKRYETPSKSKRDLEQIKENLEKTGEVVGDLFKGIFKGVGKIIDVAQEMEKEGEEARTYKKEIKGITKSGKEYRGEAGWKIGFLNSLFRKNDKSKIRKEE